MATAVVYTIKDGEVIEEFESDYNYAIGQYWGKTNKTGTYYIARKGVKIPYPRKKKALKNIVHQGEKGQSF